MRFPYVIFDLNGTLVDTFADLTAALGETLAHVGRPALDEAQVRGWAGEGLRGMLRAALLVTGPAPTDLEISDMLVDFRARYEGHLGQQARLYPGVEETLASLAAAGVRMAILTNKPQEPSVRLIAQMGIAAYFDYLLTCDGEVPRKPDPTGLAHLLQSMSGVPAQTLMVGSSRIDRETAQNAGVVAALVEDAHHPASRVLVRGLGAEYVLDDFAKLRALVLGPSA